MIRLQKLHITILMLASTHIVWAQSKAKVLPEKLAIVAKPLAGSDIAGQLMRGEEVTVDFRSTGDDGVAWCGIAVPARQISGYVRCADLGLQHSEPSRPPDRVLRVDDSAQIDRLLDSTGLERQIRQMTDPGLLSAAFASRGMAGADSSKLAAAMQQAFSVDTFLVPIRLQLLSTFDAGAVERALTFYGTALAKRVTNAELRASSPANVQAFPKFVQGLRTNPPQEARLTLVRRLYAVVDMWELQLGMIRSLLQALAVQLNPRLPPQNRLTEERMAELLAIVEKQRPALIQLALARHLFTYRTVSDADLEEYVAFWETPAGRWLRTGIYRGSMTSVETAVPRLLESMQPLLERAPQRKQP